MSKLIFNAAILLGQAAQRTVDAANGNNVIGSVINNTDIAMRIVKGQDIAKDKTYFIRSAVSAKSGTVQILNSATAKSQGTCNFVNGQLESGRALMVTKIRVAAVINAAVTGGVFSNVFAQGGIYNGEIKIEQGQKTLLDRPLSDFHNGAAGVSAEDGYLYLENPILVQPGEALTISVYFAVTTTADTNMEVLLSGAENSAR